MVDNISSELIPTDKQFVRIMSRLRFQPILRKENGDEFFATFYMRDYPYNTDDTYHEVTAGEVGRLDLISYTYYDTPLLWWVIAEANQIFHPMKDIKVGLFLRIPSPTWVYSNIVK